MRDRYSWGRSRSLLIPIAAIGLAVAGPAPAAAPSSCGHDLVCGLKNAEDLVRLPGSHWAIASRLGRDPAAPGGFSVVDLRRETARVLTPNVSGPTAPAYADCPGPPAADSMITHGLDVRWRPGMHELFAINHKGRQSVEVFDIGAAPDGPSLTWKGCVVIPSDVSANAVAALPDGLVVTSFGGDGAQGEADLLAGHPGGFVARWVSGKGWSHVPGSDFGGDNGVAASPDGGMLYVNDWGDGTVRVLSLRGGGAPSSISVGDFHPDNLHWTSAGLLLIAGQVGKASDVIACSSSPTCAVGSMIVVLAPRTHTILRRWSLAPTGEFSAASTALRFGLDYWVSSFRGDCIVQLGPAHRPAKAN
jgi:hypothetical protein